MELSPQSVPAHFAMSRKWLLCALTILMLSTVLQALPLNERTPFSEVPGSWQVTSAPLSVHQRALEHYTIIDTLPKGLPVFVVEEENDWCGVHYRGLPQQDWGNGFLFTPFTKPTPSHGGYWVECKKLLPFQARTVLPAKAGSKKFFWLPGGLNPFGLNPNHGIREVEADSYFDLATTDGSVENEAGEISAATIVNYDGNLLTANEEMLRKGRVVTLPWDIANNLPIYAIPPEPSRPIYQRYYLFVTGLLHGPLVWFLLILSLAMGFFVWKSNDKNSQGEAHKTYTSPGEAGFGLSFFLILALFVGACHNSLLHKEAQMKSQITNRVREQSREVFHFLALDNGRVLPFKSAWLQEPEEPVTNLSSDVFIGTIIWVLVFAFAHLVLAVTAPYILQGARNVLAPSPARQLLRAREGKMKKRATQKASENGPRTGELMQSSPYSSLPPELADLPTSGPFLEYRLDNRASIIRAYKAVLSSYDDLLKAYASQRRSAGEAARVNLTVLSEDVTALTNLRRKIQEFKALVTEDLRIEAQQEELRLKTAEFKKRRSEIEGTVTPSPLSDDSTEVLRKEYAAAIKDKLLDYQEREREALLRAHKGVIPDAVGTVLDDIDGMFDVLLRELETPP